MADMTKDWELYLKGKQYNGRLEPNYYNTVNCNLDMFAGNQWRNSEATGLMKPVFNIIKRVTTFFVASLTASDVAIQFEPLAYSGQDDGTGTTAAEVAGAEIDNLFEKFNMTNRIRDALFQAAIKGDVAAHFYFDPTKKPYRKLGSDVAGEICFELVSGTNVFFGNANNPDASKHVQPYIIISGRDMVENLKAEAKLYKQNAEIDSDRDYQYESGSGGQIEVEADSYGKALYIIKYKYDREKDKITASKSVQNAYIYQDVDTELDDYPISWLAWEKQDNQYHGRALITGIIPNQIFINKMFAMVMYHLMMAAFPKAVYNADFINSWSNQIGESLAVTGLGPGENIKNIAGYLEPGIMSNQITQVIDMAMAYTKESLGINDASLGNVDPKNKGAIIAVQKSAMVPLENIRANLYEWLEDIGRILLDMMGTYYGQRPIVVNEDVTDPMTGQTKSQKVVKEFDFSSFKNLWLQTRVDVGEASYWSEIASLQTLDNLLSNGMIDIVDYLDRVPDGYIPQRQELISEIKSRQAAMAQQQVAQQQQQGQYEQMAQFFDTLPPEIQKQLKKLPPHEMEQQVMAMMQQHAQPVA